MGRNKGSQNKETTTLIPELTKEERIQFIAELVVETMLKKQQEQDDIAKKVTEEL